MTLTAPTISVVQLRLRERDRSRAMRVVREVRPARKEKQRSRNEPTVLQRWLDMSG